MKKNYSQPGGTNMKLVQEFEEIKQTSSVNGFSIRWEEIVYGLSYDLKSHQAAYIAKLKPHIQQFLHMQLITHKDPYEKIKESARIINKATYTHKSNVSPRPAPNQYQNNPYKPTEFRPRQDTPTHYPTPQQTKPHKPLSN
jgi:hypothetical protein